jgi:hypothetical protein
MGVVLKLCLVLGNLVRVYSTSESQNLLMNKVQCQSVSRNYESTMNSEVGRHIKLAQAVLKALIFTFNLIIIYTVYCMNKRMLGLHLVVVL